MSAHDTLLHMDGVTKVFVTDEVETHALAGIHLELRRGEYATRLRCRLDNAKLPVDRLHRSKVR